jgi:membrane-associated protease RseP (regulator of RpoE activity)
MADKQAVLREHANELRALEAQIETRLRDDLSAFGNYPEIHELLVSAIQGAGHRREALSQYLGDVPRQADGSKAVVEVLGADPTSPSTILKRHLATFAYAIAGYTVLTELAFRLYDPPLREVAPKHLKAYASLSYAATRLIPSVIADEFAAQGLFCQCVCPMCGLGACACVTVGRQHVDAAWRDSAGTAVTIDGFPLQTPRPGSPLAVAGVKGGDVLLAVDDQQARSVPDIQAAIRKHAIGDGVLLRIGRSNELPREITVAHTSDNPRK